MKTNKFVLYNKFDYDLPEKLVEMIYKQLNESEKHEIESKIAQNPYLTVKNCIERLYGPLCFRRRMNPRFVKGVEKYLKSNDFKDLSIVEITGDKFYIHFDNTGEVISLMPMNEFDEPEYVNTWFNQITVEDEIEKPEKEYKFEIDNNITFKVKARKIYKKIVRNILKIKSKNVSKVYKELKEESNGSKKKRY